MENLDSVDFGELMAIGGVAVGGVTAWINARVNIARLQTEITYIKNEVKEEKENNAKSFEKIEAKLDVLIEKISDLRSAR